MTSSPSSQFGKYNLVLKLGMGGMAEVFKAEYRNDANVVVAIKRILPQFSQDKKLVSMLVNEAQLSMGLKHPNVVPVLDFGLVDNTYFIAMEYIRGKDLKSIMIRCKSRGVDLPIQMSIYMLIKILRGLDYAHQKRDAFDKPLHIVHRDISPHNILISLWGQVKILDFGIAKASSIAGSTQTGILKGKFSYMSPEQSRGEDVDPRTDIFSAGIVLWELLTLESYYQAETDIGLLKLVREAKVRDLRSVNRKIPATLEEIVMTALHKKSRRRFQTAEAFADALEDYQEETFGKVNEADLAAFVRSLFSVSEKDLEGEKPPSGGPAQDLITGGIDRAMAETIAEENPPARARRARPSYGFISSLGDTIWKYTLALGFVAVISGVLWWIPPKHLWLKFDQAVVALAKKVHLEFIAAPQGDARQIEISFYEQPKALYPLRIGTDPQRKMDELPFETFERIRNRFHDLRFQPEPPQASPIPNRPGSWALVESGYRIQYTISKQPLGVTITKLSPQ